MAAAALMLGTIVAIWLAAALAIAARAGIGFRQALLYAPLKLAYRIDDRAVREARGGAAPVIYAIPHHRRWTLR